MPYVNTRLGRWFYEERGQAARPGDPAIVLLHALLFDGGMWSAQLAPLGVLGRVVVIDGPGHGRSQPAPRFSLEDQAEALLDAFDALAIERGIVVGLSWGGMLGMRMALQHPERVSALALLDTSADAERPKTRLRFNLLAALVQRFGVPPQIAHKAIVPLLYSRACREARPELQTEFIRRVNSFDRRGVARAIRAVVVHRRSVQESLGSVRIPTLIVCGEDDRVTPPSRARRMAKAMPHAEVAWIAGAGHMTAIEAPEAVNRLLVPFVAKALRG